MRLAFLLLLLTTTVQSRVPEDRYNGVHVSGAIHTMMMEGHISATMALDSLALKPHLYALGAVEKLKGEIQILNGRPYVSYALDSAVRIDTSFQRHAAMLVYSQVPVWDSVPLPQGITTTEELEEVLPALAQNYAIDLEQAFPFLITGVVDSVNWHVIDWPEGDTVHSHAKHKKSGLHGKLADQDVTLLGFYSTKHQGVFTHHGTNIHMHVFSADRTIAGHVDDADFGEKMVLWLPRMR